MHCMYYSKREEKKCPLLHYKLIQFISSSEIVVWQKIEFFETKKKKNDKKIWLWLSRKDLNKC